MCVVPKFARMLSGGVLMRILCDLYARYINLLVMHTLRDRFTALFCCSHALVPRDYTACDDKFVSQGGFG